MVSHRYKCIFVHIPKSAGTSIATKLNIYKNVGRGKQDHRRLKWLKPIDSEFIKHSYQKENQYALYIKLRSRLIGLPLVNEEQYSSYFKFTFIRNPWARVHSWYRNILNDPNHMATFKVPQDCSLAWFVRNRLNTIESQLCYIQNWQGNIELDFIGRYEHLQRDFTMVCDRLGIDDYSLPQKTRIGTPSYIDAYDQESIAIIAKVFQEEIKLFNFVFGEKSGGV